MKLVVAIVLAAAPAWAQSKRYPPEPPDPDRDAEMHSHVWDSALDPERKPYASLVREATELIRLGDSANTAAAIEKLGRAIAKLPGDPEAYSVRGEAYFAAGLPPAGSPDWAHCADDLGAALDRGPKLATADHARLELELGICQGRAGRYADAERTLARAVATTPRGEQRMRLGEVRIALGKLDEAIDALTAAVESGDGPVAMMHWLLAAAYDRARRPSDADDHAKLASGYDRSFSTIAMPPYPLLGAGERDYLLGLAYRVGTPTRPEYATLYFRRFVALAPDSPWRRRAEEHLREVTAMDPTVERRTGNAPLDLDAARAIVKKALPPLRACLAKLPNSLFEVIVTRAGPRTPEAARDRPRFTMPPAGVAIVDALNVTEVANADVEAATRCLEPLADRLALPAPKERDTYYRAAIVVVAP